MSKFKFIEAEKANYAVRLSCRVMKVSHAAYYRWRAGKVLVRICRDRELRVLVELIHEGSRKTYGSPRVHAELQRRGFHCSRKRVARLMREANRSGLRRKRFRHAKRAPVTIPDLIQRDFFASAPNQRWLMDVTEVKTNQGKLYLAAVLDVFSRRLVGWGMSACNDTELALEALILAIERRQPQPGCIGHSDRGSPYTSLAFGEQIVAAKMLQSVGQPATCYDNAMMESFFATLKKDLIYRHQRFATREEAKSVIFEYVEVFYNNHRLHSQIGNHTPSELEAMYAAAETAA